MTARFHHPAPGNKGGCPKRGELRKALLRLSGGSFFLGDYGLRLLLLGFGHGRLFRLCRLFGRMAYIFGKAGLNRFRRLKLGFGERADICGIFFLRRVIVLQIAFKFRKIGQLRFAYAFRGGVNALIGVCRERLGRCEIVFIKRADEFELGLFFFVGLFYAFAALCRRLGFFALSASAFCERLMYSVKSVCVGAEGSERLFECG